MTTKQAALLAAIPGALQVLVMSSSSLLSVLTILTDLRWHTLSVFASGLSTVFASVALSAALPLFLACAYLHEPPIVIPERLRRPALIAAAATGLSGALTVVSSVRASVTILNQIVFTDWNRTLLRNWNWNRYDLTDLFNVRGPLQWNFISFPASLFSAIALPLFFFAAWRSVGGRESVKPGLKMAAVYAGLAMTASVAYGIYSGVSNEIFMWTHQAMLAATPDRTHAAGPLYRILIKSSGLFYSGSLAWFFYQFYRTMPTAQSKQRVSSGE